VKFLGQHRKAVMLSLVAFGVSLSTAVLMVTVGAVAGRRPLVAPASAASVMLMSFALPCLSIAYGSVARAGDWMRCWLAPYAGAAIALLPFSFFGGLRSGGHMVKSLLVLSAIVFAYGALAHAIRPLVKSVRVTGLLSCGLLVAMIAVPFWSGGLLRTGAGFAYGTWLVRLSPSLSVALPWVSPTSGWAFDPRTSSVLYDVWVGTDVPLVLPSWFSCAALHALLGGILLAARHGPGKLHKLAAAHAQHNEPI
jgi:hypothetical protein